MVIVIIGAARALYSRSYLSVRETLDWRIIVIYNWPLKRNKIWTGSMAPSNLKKRSQEPREERCSGDSLTDDFPLFSERFLIHNVGLKTQRTTV